MSALPVCPQRRWFRPTKFEAHANKSNDYIRTFDANAVYSQFFSGKKNGFQLFKWSVREWRAKIQFKSIMVSSCGKKFLIPFISCALICRKDRTFSRCWIQPRKNSSNNSYSHENTTISKYSILKNAPFSLTITLLPKSLKAAFSARFSWQKLRAKKKTFLCCAQTFRILYKSFQVLCQNIPIFYLGV